MLSTYHVFSLLFWFFSFPFPLLCRLDFLLLVWKLYILLVVLSHLFGPMPYLIAVMGPKSLSTILPFSLSPFPENHQTWSHIYYSMGHYIFQRLRILLLASFHFQGNCKKKKKKSKDWRTKMKLIKCTCCSLKFKGKPPNMK